MSSSEKQPKIYDVRVVVSSCWQGSITADNAPQAEEAARAAFDEGELRQCKEEIVHVDVRPPAKTFCVTYAVEQGFTVSVVADTAEDAEAIVKKDLDTDHCVLARSDRGHFEGHVIDVVEVTP